MIKKKDDSGFPGNHKLELDYPCPWEYKIIGSDQDKLKKAAAEIISIPYTIAFSHQSSKGTYISLLITLTVESEEQRTSIYTQLSTHPHIKTVL